MSFTKPEEVNAEAMRWLKKACDHCWRLGLAEGEAKYENLEKRLSAGPAISVPTIKLDGDAKRSASRTERRCEEILG